MDWNQLFLKKEDWQRKTFDRIKDDLISARNNRFIRYDNSEETHLVMIYGKSQVGKTTLILNMIGLKDECFAEVYETLRAGVPRGNSSTSTAIVYARSSRDKYGCSFVSINNLSSKNVQYFDKSGMIDHLKNIRQDVESNRINSDGILFIYIPNDFFIQDNTISSISIMDMPGIESRNHKEDIHVQNLMTKYIPISSVCIIACRSNDIQSLETTVLPNGIDWKRMAHRFILVITHAYNDGTTKQYFKTEPSKRECGFYDYVTYAYTQEIRKILGDPNQTEVYPVDVGDTLIRLCNEEIKSTEDKKEIIDTKNRILSDIRRSIINHKGERLKSALMDLETIIEHYGEDIIQNCAQNIEEYKEKIKDKEQLIKQNENYLEQLNGEDSERDEIKNELSRLKTIKDQFLHLQSGCISNLFNQTRQYIKEIELYKSDRNGDYLNDKKQEVFKKIRNNISVQIEESIKHLKQIINDNLKIDFNESMIISEADSFVLAEEYNLYPPKKGLFLLFSEKVYIDQISTICNNIQKKTNSLLKKYIEDCVSKADEIISEKSNELSRIERNIKLEEDKIKRYEENSESFKKQIQDWEEEKKEIEDKRERDQKTLASYLSYAKQSYQEQRNEIISHINNSETAEDKMLFILFLGLLDKDYQKVTGEIYGKY